MLKWMKRCLHQVHGSAGTRSALKWLRTTPFSTRMWNPKLCHDSRHAGKEENASPLQEWQEHKEERPKPMAAADQCTICAIPEQKPSWAAHSHCLVAHGLSSAHGATQGTLLRQEQKQVVLEGRLWQWHLCNTAGQAANSTAKPQVREGNEAESGCESLTPVVPDLGALQPSLDRVLLSCRCLRDLLPNPALPLPLPEGWWPEAVHNYPGLFPNEMILWFQDSMNQSPIFTLTFHPSPSTEQIRAHPISVLQESH